MSMQNVKLEKAVKGWFLTIGDDEVKHRWAVTSLELWVVRKIINDTEKIIMEEIDKCEAGCQVFADGAKHNKDCVNK